MIPFHNASLVTMRISYEKHILSGNLLRRFPIQKPMHIGATTDQLRRIFIGILIAIEHLFQSISFISTFHKESYIPGAVDDRSSNRNSISVLILQKYFLDPGFLFMYQISMWKDGGCMAIITKAQKTKIKCVSFRCERCLQIQSVHSGCRFWLIRSRYREYILFRYVNVIKKCFLDHFII